MAYTDDAVKAKLSALNETQESIVTVAQWVMFHRRHADRTAALWLQRLKDSGANKRLNLMYLANEVVQQSKARKKDDFLIGFSPIIADAAATAYKGATNEVQQKIRRVIEVWRQRQIFEVPIQEAIEARITEIDKSRSSGKPLLGGSLFSSSGGTATPLELQPVVPLHISVSKATLSAKSTASNASIEYDRMMDPETQTPAPPVHAARLSSLVKALANAEGAVTESIKARQELIAGLKKILDSNSATLAVEESQQQELSDRKASIEARKREVEDGIMRGLSPAPDSQDPSASNHHVNGKHLPASIELDRPDIEEITPPPAESFTTLHSSASANVGVNTTLDQQTKNNESTPTVQPVGADLLSSLSMPPVRHHSGSPPNGGTLTKKRKIESEFEPFQDGDAMEDLDDDVLELLRAESGGQ